MIRIVFCFLSRAAGVLRDWNGHSRSCSALDGPQNYTAVTKSKQ
jgi:hypothetical protein